jgi:hypothetical protein
MISLAKHQFITRIVYLPKLRLTGAIALGMVDT